MVDRECAYGVHIVLAAELTWGRVGQGRVDCTRLGFSITLTLGLASNTETVKMITWSWSFRPTRGKRQTGLPQPLTRWPYTRHKCFKML